MFEYTQTSLHPEGNCWQTAVACILEVDPEMLPSQVLVERPTLENPRGGFYSNVLNRYLRKHHGLYYQVFQEHQLASFNIREPGWHMLEGPTVRTPETKIEHVVVARYGKIVWDPHPSRAGLTETPRWSFLVPFPENVWGPQWDRNATCSCPSCAA